MESTRLKVYNQQNKKMKLSLVVVNYNGKHLLKDYFDSLYRQTLLPDEIVLFDNCSRDGSGEFVKRKYPSVRIISENRFNTGATLGFNIAATFTSGKFIIMQSNDISMDKNCIKVLMDTLKKDSKIGLCTSISLPYKKDFLINNFPIENAGAEMDKFGFTWPMYNGKLRKDIPSISEVFCVYGNSIIIRSEIFKKLQGFDEKYFALNDDIDLSWRVRLLGYTVVYAANSFVYHRGHATLGPRYKRAEKRYWSERNCLRTLLKNYSFFSIFKHIPLYLCILIAEMFYHVSKLRFDLFYANIRAIVWNILYLQDTLEKRKFIQKLRKINDSKILPLLSNRSFKFRFGR